ncbi:MAG: phosphohistidine phosphatase SixA [Acidobacteria bacterium]|nr:phosphohistidine phosphatase SixA [Acidobacteriota bacterium]
MAAVLELYLVRHAIAAERGPKYPDDRLRPLTADGIRRFKESVRGLAELGVHVDIVLTSPLTRAEQTATLLADGLTKGRIPVQEVEALAPGGRANAITDAIARAARKHARIALVGHQPDLGELAARLLGARGEIEFRKGAVCAIDVDGATPAGPGTLRWLLPPRVLRRLAP